MIRTLLTTAVFIGLSFSAIAQTPAVDPAKKAEINKMLELTGMNKLMDQMVDQMIASFQTNTATQEIPKEFWDKFRAKVKVNDLIEEMIPLYDKHYSLEDLKAVNAFYSTPTGQRLLQSMPVVMQESMAIGQAWGAKLGQQVIEEIKKEKEDKKQ